MDGGRGERGGGAREWARGGKALAGWRWQASRWQADRWQAGRWRTQTRAVCKRLTERAEASYARGGWLFRAPLSRLCAPLLRRSAPPPAVALRHAPSGTPEKPARSPPAHACRRLPPPLGTIRWHDTSHLISPPFRPPQPPRGERLTVAPRITQPHHPSSLLHIPCTSTASCIIAHVLPSRT